MRNDLSPSLIHHLGGSFFRPSYLVEIDYGEPTPWRWSTNQDSISWDSKLWSLMGFSISGLNWDTKITSKISLNIQNVDQTIAAVVLNNSLADRTVNIWMLYLYDRSIFRTDITNKVGSSKLTITEPIPSDTPSSGYVYIGAGTIIGAGGYQYSSWSGKTFNLISTLGSTPSPGTICYTLKTTYAAEDAVLVFNGVVDDIELDEKKCTIGLIPESTKTQYTPRRYITKPEGFNYLPQTGMKITWGNEIFTLEKAKY